MRSHVSGKTPEVSCRPAVVVIANRPKPPGPVSQTPQLLRNPDHAIPVAVDRKEESVGNNCHPQLLQHRDGSSIERMSGSDPDIRTHRMRSKNLQSSGEFGFLLRHWQTRELTAIIEADQPGVIRHVLVLVSV